MLTGRRAVFVRRENGAERRRVETLQYPLVVGPTLFGFIHKHRNALLSGQTRTISFGLVDRMESFDFTIRLSSADESQARFVLTPANPIMRLFIDDLEVDYDLLAGRATRYTGPVPQYRETAEGLESLVATTVYDYD